jgi:Fur family ferric uptake transcriptional regulator
MVIAVAYNSSQCLSNRSVVDVEGPIRLLREYLHRHGQRWTPEREAILGVVLSFEGHFSPDDVQRSLAVAGHEMSAVTVYRNLPVFADAGILRRTCLAAGSTLYERVWGREHHDHLICTSCGEVVEFEYEAIEILQRAVAESHGFQPKGHHLELLGTCSRCQAQVSADAAGRNGQVAH